VDSRNLNEFSFGRPEAQLIHLKSPGVNEFVSGAVRRRAGRRLKPYQIHILCGAAEAVPHKAYGAGVQADEDVRM
jgi:hypothetical protein